MAPLPSVQKLALRLDLVCTDLRLFPNLTRLLISVRHLNRGLFTGYIPNSVEELTFVQTRSSKNDKDIDHTCNPFAVSKIIKDGNLARAPLAQLRTFRMRWYTKIEDLGSWRILAVCLHKMYAKYGVEFGITLEIQHRESLHTQPFISVD
jgi:hypothetical protein